MIGSPPNANRVLPGDVRMHPGAVSRRGSRSQGAHGGDPCYACTPGLGVGPNCPGCPSSEVLDDVTCECVYPSGTIERDGACVPNLCPEGQAFDSSTCQCATCSPGTSSCYGGNVPGLNACCPLDGHIACCTSFLNHATDNVGLLLHLHGHDASWCSGWCSKGRDFSRPFVSLPSLSCK